ncbi:MAG TPA: hypothetical protein VHC95_05360 [Opitutales bacterium]|nr:hypothetical protein [Opitutales bacterium]
MALPLIIQDSSVLLNLLATNRLGEIMQGVGRQTMICREVMGEVLYLRDFETNERVPVDLAPLIAAGTIVVTDFSGPDEVTRFVEFAATLDDGEAASAAIAEIRHIEISTDEKKAAKLLLERGVITKLWTTPDLLSTWVNNASVAEDVAQDTLKRIQVCARYAPPSGHPLRSWWQSIIGA